MLLHAFSDLRDTKEILERRLASNLNSTILAYKNITSFDNTSRSRFLLEVEDIVMNTLHPKKVSLYIFGEQGFEVITSMGWSDDERYARRIDSKSPLHQAMVKTRRAVCAINKQDEKILGGEGVLAAPLIDSRDDSVFGMIKIEEMALADLNLNSTQIFEALSQWISTMYVTTSEYNALKQQVESNSDKKKSGVKRKKATTPKK
jgi:transcriptional regulator with GAF, ATPase, and Fis domain